MLDFLSFQKVIYFSCVNKMGEESHNDAVLQTIDYIIAR